MDLRILAQSKAAIRRETFASYLVVIAILLTGTIDITQFIMGGGYQSLEVMMTESWIDIAFIIGTYLCLQSVISSRAKTLERLANTLEDLKKTNEELTKANEFKTRLMSMAAHDLRNPIGVVRGFSEILEEETHLSPTHKQFLTGIQKKSNEMLTLINDLLDVTVLDQNALCLKKEPVLLDALVEEAIADVHQQTVQKNQHVFFDSSGPLMVNIDKLRMKQVLINLLSNASKYSPMGAPIHIALAMKEGRANLSVSDHGPGLTKVEIHEIFKVFSPVKKTTTAGESSTGLGLSIAKSLVEQHGGKISAESDGPGHGSHFIVDLPI